MLNVFWTMFQYTEQSTYYAYNSTELRIAPVDLSVRYVRFVESSLYNGLIIYIFEKYDIATNIILTNIQVNGSRYP